MFKVFITNLGKYNEGELVGKWVDLPCDDITAELESIGVKANSRYEEYFITDYENEVGYEVGEYESLEKLNELAERLKDLDNYDMEELQAYMEVYCNDIHTALEALDDCLFWPRYDMEAVAEELVDEGYFGYIPDCIRAYIDYKALARDLACECYYETQGGVIYIP